MSLEAMLLVLLGAALHAGWNAIVKASPDKFIDTVLIASGSAVLALVLLPLLPMPAPASWPLLAASVVIHVVYFALLAAAYRTGDMSLAYPIMRGVAPLAVAALSGALLGERLGTGAWAGVLLICAGVLGLSGAFRGLRTTPLAPVGFALANAAIIAAYTLVDGTGARLSRHATAYTLWMLLLTAVPLLAFAALRFRPALRAQARRRWHLGLIGGACGFASYALALTAMTQAPIAAVAALRETSILFGMALAALVLKERFDRTRLVAALAVAAGAMSLRLA